MHNSSHEPNCGILLYEYKSVLEIGNRPLQQRIAAISQMEVEAIAYMLPSQLDVIQGRRFCRFAEALTGPC